MYIRKIGDVYWACHFAGGGHGSHEIARMSDEHRRATDYIVRAAGDAGYETATEVTTTNRTRLDAVIFGDRVTGAEVQWSSIGTRAVRARTTKSLRATGLRGPLTRPLTEGVLPVWFSPSGGRPDWLYRVPTIQAPIRSWEALPARRAVRALGIREITFEPCRPGAPFDQCPERGWNFCGGLHPWARPRGGDESKGSLTVDDLFAMVPARQFVPVDFRGYVYLVDADSAARLKEFTSTPAITSPSEARSPLAPLPRACTSPVHARTLVAAPGDPQLVLDWRHATVLHRPQQCTGCGKPCHLLNPANGQPWHKTCADALPAAARPQAVRTDEVS